MQSVFQSTLPARGATRLKIHKALREIISIHAPRTGSDEAGDFQAPCFEHFNPRSPHGERRNAVHDKLADFDFNPRSPHGERPSGFLYPHTRMQISIHAPRTGSDPRKVTILSIRIIDFAQKVYHKTVLLRISLAENAVILPEKPRNPVRTSLQKAGGLRFARAIRAAHPYSISSPSGA